MAGLELDPVFVKALRLLHLRTKESGVQLKALLDQALAASNKSTDTDSKSGSKPVVKVEDGKKKDSDKRKYDKTRLETSEAEGSPSKKARTESWPKGESKDKGGAEKDKSRKDKEREKDKGRQQQQQRHSKTKAPERPKGSSSPLPDLDASTEEDEDPAGDPLSALSQSISADSFAADLGLACSVCREFNVSPGNQLVECNECNTLYHQECHSPPVVNEDVNDPRCVWYCSKCQKERKKQAAQSQKVKAKSTPSSPSGKTSKTVQPPTSQPFQRLPGLGFLGAGKDPQGSAQPLKGLTSLSKKPDKTQQPGWKMELGGDKGSGKDDKSSSSDSDKAAGWKTDLGKTWGDKDKEKEKASRSDSKGGKEGRGDKSLASGSKSGSGSGSSKQPVVSSMAMKADKRLQAMKKNAAAKQHEKRIHIK